MTSPAVVEPIAPPRRLPPEFDVLAVLLTAQAHLFNVIYLVNSTTIYRSVPAVTLLWCISLATPIAALLVARRHGGELSAGPFIAVGAVILVVVDVGMMALTEPTQWGQPGVWQWGAVGVSILALAPFRPPRDILILAGLHAGLAAVFLSVAALSTVGAHPTISGFRAVQDVSAALVPAFAAAAYVDLYGRALRLRDAASTQERRTRTEQAAARAVQEDSRRRLGDLGQATSRLLASVRDGADPRSAQVVAEARRLSAAVRSELVEVRSGTWLLHQPDDGMGVGAARWPGLIVLDPQHLLERLDTPDRTALAAVVGALRALDGWNRVSLALMPDSEDRADVVVVGIGPAVTRAVDDAAVAATLHTWGASMNRDDDEVVSVEATVQLTAPVVRSLTTLSQEVDALVALGRSPLRTRQAPVDDLSGQPPDSAH
jgi:hypothetical protein